MREFKALVQTQYSLEYHALWLEVQRSLPRASGAGENLTR